MQQRRSSLGDSELRPSNNQAHYSRAELGSPSIIDNGRRDSQGSEEVRWIKSSLRDSELRTSNDPEHFSWADLRSSSIFDRGVSQGSEEVRRIRRSSRDSGLRRSNDQAHFSRAESGSSSILDNGRGVPQGSEEVLLEIPRAAVRLVDGQGSVHLADGGFSIIRLSQESRAIAVFAKVGEDLRWPLTKDESANKLDTYHYLFTLKVPQQVEEGQNEDLDSEEDSKILNYGVTFRAEDADHSLLLELDDYLRRYSFFKAPDVMQGEEREAQPNYGQSPLYSTAERTQKRKGRLEALEEFIFGAPISVPDARSPPFNDRYADSKRKSVDGRSSDYWATLAPRVGEYSTSMAKGIASQSGSVIDGVHWCSDATIEQLQRGGDYVKARVKTKEQPTQISPRTMKNLRRVRTLSRMTDRIAKGVLAGIVTATGVVSGSVIDSRAGREFFKLAPGEVALASLDAFGQVFDAVELAGRGVLRSTSVVTSGVVTHRYGEEAGEASREGMATLGHVLSLAWTVAKVRRAFTKSIIGNAGFSKRALLKSAIAGVTTRSSSSIPS